MGYPELVASFADRAMELARSRARDEGDEAAEALKEIVRDADLDAHTRTHLQIRVNFPEVNPAFDTYRIGTMLEMVREMALGCGYRR